MAVHEESGEIVATAMALNSEVYPSGGELGWLAGDPAHAGKGLGMAVSAAVTARFIAAEYRNIHLYTEDYRLPALKTYLKLGYIPFLYTPEMPERWRAICAQLQWPFTPEVWRSEVFVDQELRQALSHILWIGGATDTGKTTVSQIIAERYELQLYNYDRHDLPQIERLAQTLPRYRAFLSASLDERWVHPEPEDLVQFMLRAFRDRFPLVIEDLLALPRKPMIVAEGFGFTPELLSPVLSSKRQAIWLVPTEGFKWASMKRRNKPSFRDKTSNPERAARNVFRRDMLLAERVKAQAQSRGLAVYDVDESRSLEEMATLIEQHFEPFLHGT